MPPINVLIVDDDSLCQMMGDLLKAMRDIDTVRQTSEVSTAIDIIRQLQPDVILLGIGRLCTTDLKHAIRRMQAAGQPARIIILHQGGQEHQVLEAFRQGAVGHLSIENARPAEIIKAIRAISRGEVFLSPGMAGAILDEIVREQSKNRYLSNLS